MELTQDMSILLRVAAAMVFGGVLGVEREMGKHAAGLRTHIKAGREASKGLNGRASHPTKPHM